MEKAKWKYIRADVYRRGITIFIGSREELNKFVEKAFKGMPKFIEDVKESDGSHSLGTTWVEEGGQSLIWIPKFPKTPTQIGNLSHEILHATFALLDYVGVEYRYDGPNEPYTYLQEYFLVKALTKRGYKDV